MSILHPTNEQETIYHFIKLSEKLDIEIVNFWTSYPDAAVTISGVIYQVEFEYKLSSFIQHRHDPRKCDLVVCWINNLSRKIEFPLPVWELSTEYYPEIYVPNDMNMNQFSKYLKNKQEMRDYSYQYRYAKKVPEDEYKNSVLSSILESLKDL